MKPTRLLLSCFTILNSLILGFWLILHPLTLHSQEPQPGSPAIPTPTPLHNSQFTTHNSQFTPARLAKLDDALTQQLAAAPDGSPIRIIIYLHTQVDPAQLAQTTQSTAAAHAQLLTQLQQTAVSSQLNLLAALTQMEQAGAVSAVRPLWIINAVAATADPAAVAGLAARPNVASIRLDASRPLIQLPAQAEKLAEIWQTTATAADEPWGIGRVQAPHAWQGLGIDGSGVTVGIMDSGVDWLHPDLLPNYRGSQGGVVNHSGSWYDAVVPTTTVPHDVLGHGTHVAGTAVGQNGIGVAPGASWIAVNIASPGGLIYDSDAHAAFQWLLAPAGNPALAPDVVNGSWSGPGYTTAFLPDIQALEAAGIITVFAAGNAGPEPETLGAPASYTQTIAAGAQDDRNTVTWFSSRGPSPLHADYHPHLIAPGARIYSSLPGGSYGYYNGTSMAAPHTTGAVALILSADPTLSRQAVTRILTETAVPISTTHPNMDSGWGRLNAYQAAAQVAQHGVLTGIARENGLPLPGILVTITTATGFEMGFETDENGRYTAPLQAGTYQITAAPFGFAPLSLTNVTLNTGTTTTRDLSLTRLPSGTLIVQLLDAESNLPVRGTIDILLTPLTLETDAYGTANVKLPAGNYTLRVRTTGYEIAYLDVTLPPGQNAARTIPLTPGKKVLLVDTGGWYYRSYRAYFADSLIRLGYAFDTHEITNPIYPAFPDQSIINNYDMLIWSSPLDSPGYIGANEVVTDYLGQGGSLFISGQDVGYYDGYGFFTQVWWFRDLQANLLGEVETTGPITGSVDTDYAGLAFTLNTADSAGNQAFPDVARPRANAFSQPIFHLDDDLPVGLQAGLCKPFRLSYLGFGLEGVGDAANRDALLSRSFAYFDSPRQETGLRWQPAALDDFAPPGAELVYPLHMQHLGEIFTDTYSLRVDNAQWPVSLSTNSMVLGPCANEIITATVHIPAEMGRDEVHDFEITAVSQSDPSVQISIPFHHKTPGHILLVDDDRWYDQETVYRAALSEAGFVFDEWNIGWDNNHRGSPSQALLNAYDFVIWYTGYDWYAPVTPIENQRLSAYLAQGGRLFLSSQDFLYYNHKTELAHTQLGVIEYQESITPTQIYLSQPLLPPNLAEPLSLTFGAFQNNGDGLIPQPNALPFVWQDLGMAGGVANRLLAAGSADKAGLSRSVFFGFPFEKLPDDSRAPLLNNIVGWLTDLGDSTFEVDRRSGAPHAARTYTITLRNDALALPNQVSMTNTLPLSLTLLPASLTGGAVYDAASRQLTWQGSLDGGAVHVITYQAMPHSGVAAGERVDNELTIAYDRHPAAFRRTASFWLDAPDFSRSRLLVETQSSGQTQWLMYTLVIDNQGLQTAVAVSTTLRLPAEMNVITSSLKTSAGTVTLSEQAVFWQGDAIPIQPVTVTIGVSRTMSVSEPEWVTAVAYLPDNATNPVTLGLLTHLPPYKHYFPIIARSE